MQTRCRNQRKLANTHEPSRRASQRRRWRSAWGKCNGCRSEERTCTTRRCRRQSNLIDDDMSRAKLEKLVKDGYKPAVVMESSPGNYQAILTVEKLGTEFAWDVANQLAERLNQQYGDPKLLGCVHPHRAPRYENPQAKAPEGGRQLSGSEVAEGGKKAVRKRSRWQVRSRR